MRTRITDPTDPLNPTNALLAMEVGETPGGDFDGYALFVAPSWYARESAARYGQTEDEMIGRAEAEVRASAAAPVTPIRGTRSTAWADAEHVTPAGIYAPPAHWEAMTSASTTASENETTDLLAVAILRHMAYVEKYPTAEDRDDVAASLIGEKKAWSLLAGYKEVTDDLLRAAATRVAERLTESTEG